MPTIDSWLQVEIVFQYAQLGFYFIKIVVFMCVYVRQYEADERLKQSKRREKALQRML